MNFQKEKKLLALLKEQIDKRASLGLFVALDADGTLWPEDANDILLHYQRRKGLRDLDDLLDPYYNKEENRHKLCELFAQRQGAWKREELKFHCREALRESPLSVFPFQRELLVYLKQKGLKICVVTASLRLLVETALELYRIPVDRVLGVETHPEADRIGFELIRPSPVAKGKGEVFLNYSQGEKCFLAGGNTLTDLPLLEMAKAPFVVHSAGPEDLAFSSEHKLKKIALQRKWILFEKI